MDGHRTGPPQGPGEQNPAYRPTHRRPRWRSGLCGSDQDFCLPSVARSFLVASHCFESCLRTDCGQERPGTVTGMALAGAPEGEPAKVCSKGWIWFALDVGLLPPASFHRWSCCSRRRVGSARRTDLDAGQLAVVGTRARRTCASASTCATAWPTSRHGSPRACDPDGCHAPPVASSPSSARWPGLPLLDRPSSPPPHRGRTDGQHRQATNGRWRARYREHPAARNAPALRPQGRRRALPGANPEAAPRRFLRRPHRRRPPVRRLRRKLAAEPGPPPHHGRCVANHLRNHILPTFGERPIASIRTSEVQAWVRSRTDVLAPATVELVFRIFSAILSAAVDDRLIARSPGALGVTSLVKPESARWTRRPSSKSPP